MADDDQTKNPPGTAPGQEGTEDGEGEKEPETLTLEEHKRRTEAAVKARLKNHVPKDLHDKVATRAAQLEAELKAEREARQALEAFKADQELNQLREKVCKDVGLPPEWWENVTGTTEADLKASAEKIKAKLPKNQMGHYVPPAGGQPGTGPNSDMNQQILGLLGIGGR